MKAKKLTVGLYLSTAIGLGLASPLFAQATADQSGTPTAAGPGQSAATSTNAPAVAVAPKGAGDEGSGDIIVTARRSEERLQDVPISITVFNQAQITNRNIVTASDLANYTPSLSSNNRFGAESSSFAIRGFTQETQTAPSVGVYFADVVAPRSQGGTTSGNGAGVGQFFDLQNVQVLKGPQGTLFGRNTTGGAVLLVPQKPTGRFEGYLEGSYGNYDMKRVQGVLNIPLTDNARLRIGGDFQDRDGYMHNVSGIGPADFNDVHYYAFRASLVVDLTPDLENYTIGSFTQSNTNGLGLKVTGYNPSPAPTDLLGNVFSPLARAELARSAARGDGYYDMENANPFAHQYIQQWQLINTTTWHSSDTLTIKNIASYSQFRQRQTADIFGGNFALGPGVPIDFVGLYNHNGYNNSSEWTFTDEVQLQGRSADGRLNYQGGFYFEKSGPEDGAQGTYAPIAVSCTNVNLLQCSDPIGAGVSRSLGFPVGTVNVGSITESFSTYRFRDLGIYAQATYKFTDQLSVTGGIRYTSDKVTSLGQVRKITFPTPNVPVYNCTIGGAAAPNPIYCNLYAKESSSKPTWMVDLDYKPTQDVLVYAKYARGYRAGGVNTSNPGFTSWGPEKVDTYELGAKTSWRGPLRGTFNIAGFYNDFSNQQLQANAIATAAGTPIAPIVNAGKSRIWGIEVDASITPFTGLTIDAAYAYLNTKLESFTPPSFDRTLYTALLPTAKVGGPLTLSPKNRVTLTGTYTLPLDSSVGRISLAATFTHTDKQFSDESVPAAFGLQPATDLLNLNVSWNSVAGSNFDIAAFATNVTAQKYTVYNAGAYNSVGYEAEVLGQPRMYGMRVRYHFGR